MKHDSRPARHVLRSIHFDCMAWRAFFVSCALCHGLRLHGAYCAYRGPWRMVCDSVAQYARIPRRASHPPIMGDFPSLPAIKDALLKRPPIGAF